MCRAQIDTVPNIFDSSCCLYCTFLSERWDPQYWPKKIFCYFYLFCQGAKREELEQCLANKLDMKKASKLASEVSVHYTRTYLKMYFPAEKVFNWKINQPVRPLRTPRRISGILLLE